MSAAPAPATDAVDTLRTAGRVLVVGAGVSGSAAARLLAAHGHEVELAEPADQLPEAARSLPGSVRTHTGHDGVDLLGGVGLVVPSPGVPEHAPVLVEALRRQLPVWSEPELALRLHPWPLLAVTGTNGKTSTTELLADMVARSGRPVLACGNIGLPVSEAVQRATDGTLLVAELSSFQLRFTERLRPEAGVLLNLAPDHLDWHGELSAYHAAKARLWQAQEPEDWALANADDRSCLRLLSAAPAQRATFSGSRPVELGVGVEGRSLVARLPGRPGAVELFDLSAHELPPHRIANAAAAAATALVAGVPDAAVTAAIAAFRPGRHRYEVVGTSAHGVRFIDDSKATNAHAARAALRAGGPIVWIAGGRAKGASLAELADDLADVRAAVLLGEAADELTTICDAGGVPSEQVATIEEAVERAAALAEPGDVVLLSPACASFDQFRDYVERGERFAAAARAHTTEVDG